MPATSKSKRAAFNASPARTIRASSFSPFVLRPVCRVSFDMNQGESRYKEFVARLQPLCSRARPWRGVTFRSVDLAYASPAHVLSGKGSLKAGGRWNAPGAFAAVYSSTRPGTAVEEAFQLAADFQLAPDDLKPRITCGIEWISHLYST
jgi:hypothetical protein